MKALRDVNSFFQEEILKIKKYFTSHSGIRTCLYWIKVSEDIEDKKMIFFTRYC
jgi:hypothetical protein